MQMINNTTKLDLQIQKFLTQLMRDKYHEM